jgi:hypothetical protein
VRKRNRLDRVLPDTALSRQDGAAGQSGRHDEARRNLVESAPAAR